VIAIGAGWGAVGAGWVELAAGGAEAGSDALSRPDPTRAPDANAGLAAR
jgi:hypothetical protein